MRRPSSKGLIVAAAAVLAAGCNDIGGGPGDGGRDTAALDAADDTTEPLLDLPRPTDWAIGIWLGVMPAESTPGTPSVLAGKTVRLQLTAPDAVVAAPDEGRYYKGQVTWDAGGAGQWSVSFDGAGLGSSYAVWRYDPSLHSESWEVAAVPDGMRKLDLSTAYLGATGESPTELVLDWAVRDDAASIDETNGATIGARLRLVKQ